MCMTMNTSGSRCFIEVSCCAIDTEIGTPNIPPFSNLTRQFNRFLANRRSSYLSTDATERSTSPSSSSPPSSSTTPPPLIFVIPHVHTLLHTIFTNPSPDDPTPSFAGATPTLLPRTSRELDRAEEGQAPGMTLPAGQTGRIPGGLNDRGFW